MTEHHSLRGRDLARAKEPYGNGIVDGFLKPAFQDLRQQQLKNESGREPDIAMNQIFPRAQREALFPKGTPTDGKFQVGPGSGSMRTIGGMPIFLRGLNADTVISIGGGTKTRKRRMVQPPSSLLNTIEMRLTVDPSQYWSEREDEILGRRAINKIIGNSKLLFYMKPRHNYQDDKDNSFLGNIAMIAEDLLKDPDMPLPPLAGVLRYSSDVDSTYPSYGNDLYGSHTISYLVQGSVPGLVNYWVNCKPAPIIGSHLWIRKTIKDTYTINEITKEKKIIKTAQVEPFVSFNKIPPSGEFIYIGYVQENGSNVEMEARRNRAALNAHMTQRDAENHINKLEKVCLAVYKGF